MNYKISVIFLIMALVLQTALYAQKPHRVGTTAANFLEYGFGAAGAAMGDACLATTNDISAMYWNPAGMAFMEQSEAQMVYQPWIVDINTSFAAAGLVIPSIGTIGLGFISVDYGEMDVTTVTMQEGTGETFSSSDYAISLSYARLLTEGFGFGISGKYIGSKIWHMQANALAVDMGVVVRTYFFSRNNELENGLRLAMSISNYGTRMKYDGIDLVQSIDIAPDEDGNFKYVEGQYRLSEWELPLIFRIGASMVPFHTENQRLVVAVDALHPNNNAESVNLGMQYELDVPSTGKFFLRGGYKALFLPDSEYGLSLGAGMVKYLMNNLAVKIDYAYRDLGLLGKVHSYSVGFLF